MYGRGLQVEQTPQTDSSRITLPARLSACPTCSLTLLSCADSRMTLRRSSSSSARTRACLCSRIICTRCTIERLFAFLQLVTVIAGPPAMQQPFTFQLSADTNHSIRDILLARGCIPHNPHTHSHCNLHWTTKQYTTAPPTATTTTTALFNHYAHTANVTQKDALARTMRRLRAVYGGQLYSFTPLSFILPRERAAWHEAAKRGREERRQQEDDDADEQQLWIVKPSLSSQGRNISLVADPATHTVSSSPAVCQRYIGRPHLIDGHKYDLRIYVLVTSCRPLRAYLCQQGLCRFSSERYTPLDTANLLAHLTNSSLHKHSSAAAHKWTLARYLAHTHSSPAAVHSFWLRLTHLVLLTLLPLVADVAGGGGSGAFELFGFDVLVDERWRLWLLEVNKSPAIAMSCDEDRQVKLPMLNDLLDVLHVQRAAPVTAVHSRTEREESKEQLSFGVDRPAPALYGRRSVSLSQRNSPVHSRQSSTTAEQKGAMRDVGCWQAIWPSNEREAELNEGVSDERMKADRQAALLLSRYQQAIVDTVKQQRTQHRRQLSAAKHSHATYSNIGQPTSEMCG